MHLDKYKDKQGFYVDPDGCSWETPEDFLQGYVLGFCCCGDPDANVKYIARVLEHIDDLKNSVWTKDITYEEWYEKGRGLGTGTSLQFTYYFLDSKGLTEHGTSVPGWLTDKGREFLEDVKERYWDIYS